MKLWLLRPVESVLKIGRTIDKTNPWEPRYDKCFGFVVVAETEKDAREIADEHAEAENYPCVDGVGLPMGPETYRHPWLYSEVSTCKEIGVSIRINREIVLSDIRDFGRQVDEMWETGSQ